MINVAHHNKDKAKYNIAILTLPYAGAGGHCAKPFLLKCKISLNLSKTSAKKPVGLPLSNFGLTLAKYCVRHCIRKL